MMITSNSKGTTPLIIMSIAVLTVMVAFVGSSEEIPVQFSDKTLVDQGWFVSMDPADFPITNEGKVPALNIGLIHRESGSRIFVLATTSSTPLYLDAVDRQPPDILLKHLRLEKKYSSGHLDRGFLPAFDLDAIQWKLEGPGDGVSFLPQGKRKTRTLGLRTVISLAAIGPDGHRVNVLLTGFFRGPLSGKAELQAEYLEFMKTLKPKDNWTILPHQQVAEIETRDRNSHIFEKAPAVIRNVIARTAENKPIQLSTEERSVLEEVLKLAPNDPAATLLLLADKGGEKPVFIGSDPKKQYRKYTDDVIELWKDASSSRIMAMAYGRSDGPPASDIQPIFSKTRQICAVKQQIEFATGRSTFVFACQAASPNVNTLATGGEEFRFSNVLGWIPRSPTNGTTNTKVLENEIDEYVYIAHGDTGTWIQLGQPVRSISQKEDFQSLMKKACSGKQAARWSEGLESRVKQIKDWKGMRFLMENQDGSPVLVTDGLKTLYEEKDIRKNLKKGGPAYPLCVQE